MARLLALAAELCQNRGAMTSPHQRRTGGWAATLAWVLLLVLVGAGLAVWGLSRWDAGARFLGVAPEPPALALQPVSRLAAAGRRR